MIYTLFLSSGNNQIQLFSGTVLFMVSLFIDILVIWGIGSRQPSPAFSLCYYSSNLIMSIQHECRSIQKRCPWSNVDRVLMTL